jgi:hypothetical protein
VIAHLLGPIAISVEIGAMLSEEALEGFDPNDRRGKEGIDASDVREALATIRWSATTRPLGMLTGLVSKGLASQRGRQHIQLFAGRRCDSWPRRVSDSGTRVGHLAQTRSRSRVPIGHPDPYQVATTAFLATNFNRCGNEMWADVQRSGDGAEERGEASGRGCGRRNPAAA